VAFAEDYVDVAERIRLLLAQYPDASITTSDPRIIQIADRTFIEVTATVQCKDDTGRVSRDTAWEPFPGKTPYTRDSEMMNASTSAVGRAIGLLGIGLKKSIATSNEVRNRREDAPAPRRESTSPGKATDPQLNAIRKMAAAKGIAVGEETLAGLTKYEASQMIDELKGGQDVR